MSEVAINVWILGLAAHLIASQARSISFKFALLKPATSQSFICFAINFTELKSYEPYDLDKDLTIMCNPDGFDSWLYVKYKEKSLLNLNDCRLNELNLITLFY